eukprot:COSAG02_NODE_6590_length_3473_cov_2.408000_6_plen_341_part_00
MVVVGARVAALLGLLPLAAAPFSCSSISIDCMCNWGSSGAWMQVGGLTKAPAEAQGSAEDCERWCCTKIDGWKDSPANGAPPGKTGTPGTGRCQTWQYMPADPTGKENLGCWAGISSNVDMYTKGNFHSNEWVGASQCLGVGTDWGTPFLVVLFLGSALYLGGGALYLKKKHGAAGKDLLPHRRKWQHVHGLVLDGCSFARGGGKAAGAPSSQPLLAHGGKAVRSDVEDGRRSGNTEGKRASSESEKRDSSSGRKPKESKASKSSGSGSKSKSKSKSKGAGKTSGTSRSNDKDDVNVPAGEGAAESDRGTASERLLLEQVEQDERLHQSQAKIKVVGLNG